MILLALMVSMNSIAKNYAKVQVVVKSDIPGKGKVAISSSVLNANSNLDNLHWTDDTISTTLSSRFTPSTSVAAKAEEGVAFVAWYSDENCTTLASEYNPWSASGTNKTTEESTAPTNTYYAKFVSVPATNHYAQIQYIEDEDHHGAFETYNEYWEQIYKYSIANTDLSNENYQERYKHSWNYVSAVPLRGYQFTSWTLTGEHAAFTVDDIWDAEYFATDNPTYIDISSASDDPESPEVATIQPNFDALDPLNFTIRKAVDRGSVAVRYENYLENDGGDGLELKTVEMEAFSVANTEKSYTVYESDRIILTATPADGYTFFGWYGVNSTTGKKTLISEEATWSFYPETDTIYYAYFNRPITDADKFKVGYSLCQSLEQALAAVTAEDTVILQINNYTVPKGHYTIPAGVTLLIPRNAHHKAAEPDVERVVNNTIPTGAYRTLTLADSVYLDVYGTIEVGGNQYVGGEVTGSYTNGTGRPGELGHLIMNGNSSITLNNGAVMRAWGFVTGTGSIDARRGSVAKEQFQLRDWKGGSKARDINNSASTYGVFPVHQYFIQNIEVPVTYRPGSRLYTNMGIYLPSWEMTAGAPDVQIIGVSNRKDLQPNDVSMFLMDDNDDSEDSWVRKRYDATNDKQVYEVNNNAHLGSITINVEGTITMSSSAFDLPITNNMKIHLLSGKMDITQNTVLLPGAELELDKKSTVTINEGKSLYLYDSEQWDKYAHSGAYAKKIVYRPSGVPSRDVSTAAALGDATINVHGTFEAKGSIYTTASGANIYSSVEDAGTIKFISNAGANKTVYQWKDSGDKYYGASVTSAQLKNESGFTPTAGTEAGNSFCYIDFNGEGKWKSLTTVECFTKDEDDVYYIKPGAYVPISRGSEPTPEADHTYRDHYAGTGKIFIQTDITGSSANCQSQWWEVTAVPGHPDLFYCDHEDNRTYYCWKDDKWQEKKFTVTWKNWNDTVLTTYQVKYNTVPQYLSTNPTHGDDASHTYSFSGWLPTPVAVTGDVTYVAQFAERDRMYAITFNDQNDELIELVYATLGSIPSCSKPYDSEHYEWSPVIGTVAGNQTYTLVAKPETPKTEFTIVWKNWNGDVIRTDADKTTMLAAPADPSKASDALHSYAFDGWQPEPVAAGTTLTADAVYTAKYISAPLGFTVIWKNGETTLEMDTDVPYGTVPEYNGATPTHGDDVFNGWDKAITAVTGNVTYTAQFRQRLTVSENQEITTNKDYETITVQNGQALTVAEDVTVITDNLILQAGSNQSGQVVAIASGSNISATNAYFDLSLNTAARHWNAFGVPWVVNLDITPLQEVDGSGNVIRTLVLGRDYDIVYYNGAKRASQGAGYWCWEYVENHAHLLQPGKGYMIGFTTAINIVRFAKAAGAPVIFNGEVELDANAGTRSADDNGWNAMANPMAYHATMNDGPTVGYVHNGGAIGSDGYDKFDLDGGKFIVGKTVYVQSSGDEVVTPTYAAPSTPVIVAAAPARRASVTDKKYLSLSDFYTVGITDAAGKQGGDVCVLPEEDKADKYVIGHDLSQFGMSAAIPQLWIKRYNAQLALNTTAPINEVAEFPMGVYVPAADEYTISLNAQPNEDYTVYLTQDGQVIWNLSNGAYTVSFAKGSQAGYGLRLTENKAPQVVTGIDEAIVDANGETRKVLINNQVFIIRGNKVYSVDGQMVK